MFGDLEHLDHGLLSALPARIVVLGWEECDILLCLWEMVDVGQLVLSRLKIFLEGLSLLSPHLCVLKLTLNGLHPTDDLSLLCELDLFVFKLEKSCLLLLFVVFF